MAVCTWVGAPHRVGTPGDQCLALLSSSPAGSAPPPFLEAGQSNLGVHPFTSISDEEVGHLGERKGCQRRERESGEGGGSSGKGGGLGEPRECLEKGGSPWVGGEPRREERPGESGCIEGGKGWGQGALGERRGLLAEEAGESQERRGPWGGRMHVRKKGGPCGDGGPHRKGGVTGKRRMCQKRNLSSGREKGPGVDGPSPQGKEGGFQ